MKPIALLFAALLLFAGCGKSAKEELVGIVETATEKVGKATSLQEAQEANDEMIKELEAYERENPKACEKAANDPDTKAALNEAMQKYMQVLLSKTMNNLKP